MTDLQKKLIAAAALTVFVIFCAAIGYYIGTPMITLANDPAAFQEMVNSYGFGGKLIFIGMVALQVLVAFIPGEPIELAAGYAFGFWQGSILTLIGFLLGSWIVFVLVRKLGTGIVEVFFPAEKIRSLSFLKNPQKTKVLAFVLMLIPGTPKDFLSYFAGLTQLELKQWLLIVAVGRIPSLVTSTATGAAAGEKNYALSAAMLVITGILSLLGILYYRRIINQQSEAGHAEYNKTEQ